MKNSLCLFLSSPDGRDNKDLKSYTPSTCTGRSLSLPSSFGPENILKDLTIDLFEGTMQGLVKITFPIMGNVYTDSQ